MKAVPGRACAHGCQPRSHGCLGLQSSSSAITGSTHFHQPQNIFSLLLSCSCWQGASVCLSFQHNRCHLLRLPQDGRAVFRFWCLEPGGLRPKRETEGLVVLADLRCIPWNDGQAASAAWEHSAWWRCDGHRGLCHGWVRMAYPATVPPLVTQLTVGRLKGHSGMVVGTSRGD